LNDPVTIEVARSNQTADRVTQVVYKVAEDAKRDVVSHLIRNRHLKQVLVFSNTKIGASRLARELEKSGVKASAIHGDKTQSERMAALEAFKSGEIDVLVATDVAARGLDISDLPCVINYDLPYNAEDYVHRIGRTGRAGASGDAISLYSDKDERLLLDIEKMIKHKFVPAELVGYVAPSERRPRRDTEEASPRSSAERPQRSDRPVRPQREDSSRSETDRGDRPRPPVQRREKVDPWFLKPYEPENPSVPTAVAKESAPSSISKAKPRVAALLGRSKT
jgi:ATP-dependent RNA helicase RhlE